MISLFMNIHLLLFVFPVYRFQISTLAAILFEKECSASKCPSKDEHECKYGGIGSKLQNYGNGDEFSGCESKTVMHLAAEEGLLGLIIVMVDFFPGLVHIQDDDDDEKYPVELALENDHDDVAAVLIKHMNKDM